MKRQKGKKKLLHNIKASFLFFSIATAIVGVSFSVFYSNVYKQNEEYLKRQLEDVAVQSALIFKVMLEEAIFDISNASLGFSSYQSIDLSKDSSWNKEEFGSRLQYVNDNSYFSYSVIVDRSGHAYSSKDVYMNDVTNHEAYQKGMKGEKGVTNVSLSYSTREDCIVVYSPIYNKDGEITGLLLGINETSTMANYIDDNVINGQGLSHIIQVSGEPVYLSNNKYSSFINKHENVWKTFEEAEYSVGYSYEKMREDFEKGESGYCSVILKGNSRMIYYAPVGMNNFYIITAMPESAFQSYIEKIIDNGIYLMISMLLVGITGVVLFYIYNQRRTMELEMFESLSVNSLVGIFKIKLDNDFTIIYGNDVFYKLHGYSKESMEKLLEKKAKRYIPKASLEYLERFLNAEIAAEKETTEFEIKIMTEKKEIKWVRYWGVFIRTDKELFLSGCVVDINNQKKIEKELKFITDCFYIATKQTSNIVFIYNKEQKMVRLLGDKSDIFGLPDFIENVPESFFTHGLVDKAYVETYRDAYKRIEDGQKKVNFIAKVFQADGKCVWHETTIINIFDKSGKVINAVGYIEDITEKKELEINMKQQEEYMGAITSESYAIHYINVTKNFVYKEYLQPDCLIPSMLHKTYTELYSKIHSLTHSEDKEVFERFSMQSLLASYSVNDAQLSSCIRLVTEDNEIIWVQCTSYLLKDPNSKDILSYCLIKDINEQKMAELELREEAEKDALTGLYNRTGFLRHVENYIARSNGTLHELVIFDIDNFKSINDTYGHLTGDSVLAACGKQIRDLFNEEEAVVSRIGGDEFMIFITNIDSPAAIKKYAKKICEAVREIEIEGLSDLHVTISVGISLFPMNGSTFTELYEAADKALYMAKKAGKNQYVIF